MRFLSLGTLSYGEAYARQLEVHAEVMAERSPDTVMLVEHPPVLTLGTAFRAENLRLPREAYAERGIEVVTTDRGGDVTYHGPGQLVAYPIVRLVDHDVHAHLRRLESTVIEVCRQLGVAAGRNPVNTGVWVGSRKICAIGIKVRRWVTLHGFALNCNVDLSPFGLIVPCGIGGDYGVTSLTVECGRTVSVAEVAELLPTYATWLRRHPEPPEGL